MISIFLTFLKLGCVSFGGPVAHLGYFREAFVVRRKWLSEGRFGQFLALTQLLPGPSSSQVGFLIGTARGGIAGGVAAWAGFTLPSAILMLLFGAGVQFARGRYAEAVLHGLQVAAIAVVANATFGMFRRLCPDFARAAMAFAAAALVIAFEGPAAQMAAIVAGGLAGWWLLRLPGAETEGESGLPVSGATAAIAGIVFAFLFAGLGWAAANGSDARLPYAFYRTGSLVFGGGHVVLPLLDQAVVRSGWVDRDDFLAGYGAAQTIPGPLFTFAAYLGFVSRISPNGVAGGLVCLAALFLPGLLLATAVAPFWHRLSGLRGARGVLAGINAAVVGLLASALVHAGMAGAIGTWADGMLAALAVAVLIRTAVSPVFVVIATALIAALVRMVG